MARRRHPIRAEYQELPRTDEQFLTDLFLAAKKYDFFARKTLLFIYHENHKDPSYKMYEAYFGRQNFMHLVGLKGKTINAKEFYQKCLDGTLKILPIPVTVVKRQITDYVSNPQNVVAVLMKDPSEGFYNTLVGCVKRGLSMESLPKEIRRKITPDAPPELRLEKGLSCVQLSPASDSDSEFN